MQKSYRVQFIPFAGGWLRLLESGSLLLEEVEAYLDQFTRFKDIENALNEALSGVINFTVVTESAERSTASLADHLRKQLGVVDSLLQVSMAFGSLCHRSIVDV